MTIKKLTQLLLLLLFSFVFESCNDEDYDSITIPAFDVDSAINDAAFASENFGESTTANFIGTIKDWEDNPLPDTQITIGNTVTYTDRNGIFIINNVDVFENFAYVKASKPGYIEGSRVVIPKTDGENRIEIELREKNVTRTVNSGEVSELQYATGGVTFGGGFIRPDGSQYNGQVEVLFDYLRPNSFTTFLRMPGSLFAQTEDNDARSLETYGMLSINLFSPSGEELNIDPNTPATIKFKIDFTQTDIAPETINLWYFDEQVGYWKEEGVAVKEGDEYLAEVTHFTWWNCDLPLDFVNLCFSLSPTNDDASSIYYAQINRVSNDQLIFSGQVYSDAGLECGLIPENEEVKISIYGVAGDCFGQLIDEQIFGPFSSDANIDVSFTEEFSSTTITGTVTNCSGIPLTNGYVFIDIDNIFNITDGILNFGIQHCSINIETIDVQIYDYDTGLWSIVDGVVLNGDSWDLGMLSTCEDTGGVFNGDVTLETQEQVNNFGLSNYTTINGSLNIGGNFNQTSNITDLSPLINLEAISEFLKIEYNNITSLDGFSNLNSVGYTITVRYNTNLISLEGLDNLQILGGLKILNNPLLTSLVGLEQITTINGAFRIQNNTMLSSINQLSNLTSVGELYIENNTNLVSIVGLNQITSISWLQIRNQDLLTDLSELSGLINVDYLFIAGNDGLTSLNGLQNLIDNLGLYIGIGIEFDIFVNDPNINLTDFCGLTNLFVNGNYVADGNTTAMFFDGVTIVNNAYNPTIQDIIDGNCSQ